MREETDLTAPGAVEAVLADLAGVEMYVGLRVEGNVIVTADGVEISPKLSQAVWNHSPDGFNWGYGGSGPAQLALALLLHERLPADLALRLYQVFKRRVVAAWDTDNNWFLRGSELREFIRNALEVGKVAQEQQRQGGEWNA